MKKTLFLLGAFALPLAGQSEPFKQAEVTMTVNSVSLLKANQAPRPAASGDLVNGSTAVKTGADSRAELQFPDRTITRIGANALFRFREGGREMTLDGGTMLFSSPKGAGGGEVQAGAVTAAVTGTNFLLYYLVGGDVKVVVLEGKVLLFLTANPAVRQMLRAGQIAIIPAGATKFDAPYSIDLKRLISTSRLLESGGFKPLPVHSLLMRVADGQQGKIKRLPGSIVRDQQAAQTARNTVAAGFPKPVPMVTPAPKPHSAPPPLPPPPPPKPQPSCSPCTHAA